MPDLNRNAKETERPAPSRICPTGEFDSGASKKVDCGLILDLLEESGDRGEFGVSKTGELVQEAKGEQRPSRRSRKKEQTRRNIFSAAMSLFGTHDYDTVTIEEICEKADVAKATFFLHFPSKGSLLKEFNERLAADLKDRLEGHGGDAATRLRFVADALAEEWRNNAPIMQKMLREFVNQPALPEALTEVNLDLVDIISALVDEGQKKGEFRDTIAPHLMAASLIATWSTFLSVWLYEEDFPEAPAPDDGAGDAFLDIVLNGLKA